MKTYKYLDADHSIIAVFEDGLQKQQVTAARLLAVAAEVGETVTIEPHVPPTPQAVLDEWRDGASVDKATFLIRVMKSGILTKADAKSAARGVWPQSMNSALAAMTQEEADMAEITWATAQTIKRNSPIITYVQEAANLTDLQVDGLFE